MLAELTHGGTWENGGPYCCYYCYQLKDVFLIRQKERNVNTRYFITALGLMFFVTVPSVSFAQGKALITSPTDGATLDGMDENRLAYEVVHGPRGDHAHLYVDNKEVAILRKSKGSYLLETLSSGKHSLCVKVVNKAHVPIGIEQCIQVTVK
ncbi:MAG TPA: hypothetical protein VMV78_08745 [Thiobacillus sp.]|nr:hypothetical protein [Thiobacillus sp.]